MGWLKRAWIFRLLSARDARVEPKVFELRKNRYFIEGMLAVSPALEDAQDTHVFFIRDKSIFVLWQGRPKHVYKQLRGLIGTALIQPGLFVEPSIVVTLLDPKLDIEAIKAGLKAEKNAAAIEAAGLKKYVQHLIMIPMMRRGMTCWTRTKRAVSVHP